MMAFFFLIEPCQCCFKQLTRLRSGLHQAFRVLRDAGPSPVVRGERVPSSRAVSSSGGRGGPWLPYSARVFNIYGNSPFGASLPLSPVPLLVSVGLDIFGFHRDHKKLQQQFYTQAWLKQNLGTCGRLANKPTLAQCSQMLLRTFPVLV